MNVKKYAFIFVGSIPVVLLVYVGQPLLGVLIALAVMAVVLFVPAFQSEKPAAENAPATPARK